MLTDLLDSRISLVVNLHFEFEAQVFLSRLRNLVGNCSHFINAFAASLFVSCCVRNTAFSVDFQAAAYLLSPGG